MLHLLYNRNAWYRFTEIQNKPWGKCFAKLFVSLRYDAPKPSVASNPTEGLTGWR